MDRVIGEVLGYTDVLLERKLLIIVALRLLILHCYLFAIASLSPPGNFTRSSDY